MNKRITASSEDHLHLDEIEGRINESAKEIHRVNEALGLGLVTVKCDGIYREFDNSGDVLIKSGDFRRKKLANRHIKVR